MQTLSKPDVTGWSSYICIFPIRDAKYLKEILIFLVLMIVIPQMKDILMNIFFPSVDIQM